MVREVSGLSARASVSTKGTCCGDCQQYPLARGHLSKRHGGGSLRAFCSRESAFQRDMLREVSLLSFRSRAPSKGTCCGECLEHPLTRGHLPKGYATWKKEHPLARGRLPKGNGTGSLKPIYSRFGAFQRDMLRGEYPLTRGYLPKGHDAVSLRTIRSRQRTLKRDMLRGVSGHSARASAPSEETCCGESQDYPLAPAQLPQ